jgi:nitrilase
LLKVATPLTAVALIVLPEMFATGFSMNAAALAEPVSERTVLQPGAAPTTAFLSGLAREFEVYLLGGLIAVTRQGRCRNQAVVFSPSGEELLRYSKCQPFTLGGESKHYEAGTEIMTFKWEKFTVAPFVCYDLRFPELFREGVRRGVQLFVVIANWPIKRIHHWVTLLRARAIENLAYVLAPAQGGYHLSGRETHGHSMIVDPWGVVLDRLPRGSGVVVAGINPTYQAQLRRSLPALMHRTIHRV